MARRKRKSGGEELVEGLSHLPWQVCVLLAPVAFLLFHWLAQVEPPPARDVSQLGSSAIVSMFKVAGMFLKYLAPFALLLAGLLSWIRKRRRTKMLFETEARSETAPLQALSWREFEQLVGAHFERRGCTVGFTPSGADGGVDIVAKKGAEIFLIQCKQWRATKVGVGVVRELFGVMAARGATGGYVVSIGEFTDDARAFASGRNIELIDAHALIGAPGPSKLAPAESELAQASSGSTVCPQCGSPMVRRTAQRGDQKGRSFFGCSTYPRCRGTRPA